MNLGDLVVRRSYGGDIAFRIDEFKQDHAILKGTEFRLLADSPLKDLVKATSGFVSERSRKPRRELMSHYPLFRVS